MFVVTADPTVAFVDAIKAKILTNATLVALVTGVYGHLSQAARTAYPYIVLGRRSGSGDGDAFGLAGSSVSLQIDIFSDAKGPATVSQIASEVFRTLDRQRLTLAGFSMVDGSLTREFQEVFDEPDPDKPDAILYHAVQRWTATLMEAA